MRIKAEKVKGKDLRPGDLFSTAGQLYWDGIEARAALAEKVYIRMDTPCPESELEVEIFRITIEE